MAGVKWSAQELLQAEVQYLSKKETYGQSCEVRVVETHMSWVFVTEQYVYKLKKPVCYDFLDFTTLEARHHFCNEEVQINKVLAPGVYLGTVPLVLHGGSLLLHGKGRVSDWLVKMKRLPEQYMLDYTIKAGTVQIEWVENTAKKLAAFYKLAQPENKEPEQYRQKIVKSIEDTRCALMDPEFDLERPLVDKVAVVMCRFVEQWRPAFDQRIRDGRIMECHGDLRPEHICLYPEPLLIDRIEFDRELRVMDVAEELAFLMLECELLGAPAVGELFLNAYQSASGDKIPLQLIDFYKAKKAFMRARLSVSHLLEERYRQEEKKWKTAGKRYLLLVKKYCERLTTSNELINFK